MVFDNKGGLFGLNDVEVIVFVYGTFFIRCFTRVMCTFTLVDTFNH